MNWSRTRLKEMARTALHGSYWRSVLVAFILLLITGGTSVISSANNLSEGMSGSDTGDMFSAYSVFHISGALLAALLISVVTAGIISIAISIFVLNPLEVGCRNYFRKDIFEPQTLEGLGVGFQGNYLNVVKTIFLRDLYIFLWSLLFIIPGIIKSYEYMMVPYLLSEDPNMSADEAFARSRAMMDGEKWNAFVLDLSFLGWNILGACTLGILTIFYVAPYQYLTHAALYGALKQKMMRMEHNETYTY